MPSTFAPAKLNLGLHVLRRRADGFHDLSTVFCPIEWSDVLHVRPGDIVSLTCTDTSLPLDERNLVIRATTALSRAFGIEAGAALHLEKVLPAGAGLGGGSSDAAAALRLLCDYWNIECEADMLHTLALEVGSDVPFFLNPKLAHATGRGEILNPLKAYTMPFALVVVVPSVHVSTAWAFKQVTPRTDGRADLKSVVKSNDLELWRRELSNDFEPCIFRNWPVIRDARDMLLRAGAGYAALTGTGSAVYGVFEGSASAKAAAQEAEEAGLKVWNG